MKKQLVIVGIAVLLICVGFSGCLETNLDETSDEEPQSEAGFEWFQMGNTQSITQTQPKQSRELMDNRIGALWHNLWPAQDFSGWTNMEILDLGLKRGRLAINELDWDMVNWSESEFYVDPAHDAHINDLVASGITITYVLSFWDKANHPQGWGEISSRFKTEEEIQRYLEFVQFIVHHFKDRIRYFEIWNEPDNNAFPVQYIEVADYINLVKRTVPVIRQEYPQAKIVVGSISYIRQTQQYSYLFNILRSEIMSLVDVVAWHPMYGTSPAYDEEKQYFYEYPSIVQQIKNVSSSYGFRGEYRGDELTWWSPECFWVSPNEPYIYNDTICAKYYARGIIMHLGMNVTVGIGGWSSLRPVSFPTVRNLCTIMAGANTINLPIEIHSEATNIKNYSFSLPNNDTLIAFWTDGIAVENDTGVNATIIIKGVESSKVIAIDTLKGYEQQLLSINDNDNLTLPNLLVRDYPLILQITN